MKCGDTTACDKKKNPTLIRTYMHNVVRATYNTAIKHARSETNAVTDMHAARSGDSCAPSH